MAIIASQGEGITITKVVRSPTGDYGEPTESTSPVSTTAIIVLLTSEDNEVKSGILQTGDARGYFATGNEDNLAAGNRITYQSKEYEIVGEPRKFSMGGKAIHLECNLKRFQKG